MKLQFIFLSLTIGLLVVSCGSFRPSYIQYQDGIYNDDIDTEEYSRFEKQQGSRAQSRQSKKTIEPTNYKSYFLLKSLQYQSESLDKLDYQSTNNQQQYLNPPANQDRQLQSRYESNDPYSYDRFQASYYGLGWNVPTGYFMNYGINSYAPMGYGYYNPYDYMWNSHWGWSIGYSPYGAGFGGYYNPYWGWGGYYGGGGYYNSYYGGDYYSNNNDRRIRRDVDRSYSRKDSRRNYSENYNVGQRSSYDSNNTPSRPIKRYNNNSYTPSTNNSYRRSSAPTYRSSGSGARRSSSGYNAGRR